MYLALNRRTLELERLEYPNCYEASVALHDNPEYATWVHEGQMKGRFKRLGPHKLTIPPDLAIDGELEVFLNAQGAIDVRLRPRKPTRHATELPPEKVMTLIPLTPETEDVNRRARRNIVLTMQHLAMLYRTAVLGSFTQDQEEQIEIMLKDAHALHGQHCEVLVERKVTMTKIAEIAGCTRSRIGQRIEFGRKRAELQRIRATMRIKD